MTEEDKEPKKGEVPDFYDRPGNRGEDSDSDGDDWETVGTFTDDGSRYRVQKRPE